jgi:DNA polymerase I
MLGVGYGMGPETLSYRIRRPRAYAAELLKLHRQFYPRYWEWAREQLDGAFLRGETHTCFGWTQYPSAGTRWRSLLNFPAQATGAEMLRLATCLATETGVEVSSTIHDALLVESPARFLEEAVALTERAMTKASEVILDGFALKTKAELVRHPDHYADKRGTAFWERVWRIIREAEGEGYDFSRYYPAAGIAPRQTEFLADGEVPF